MSLFAISTAAETVLSRDPDYPSDWRRRFGRRALRGVASRREWEMARLHSRRAFRTTVRDLLVSIGDNATSVGDSLARQGVRGRQNDKQKCAIAVYLHVVLSADPGISVVQVGNSMVRIRSDHWRRQLVVPLPSAVRAFIRYFDAGHSRTS